MFQEQAYIINLVLMLLDGALLVAAAYLALALPAVGGMVIIPPPADTFTVSILCTVLINNYVCDRLGLYGSRRPEPSQIPWRLLKACVIDFAVLGLGLFLLGARAYPRSFFIAYFATSLLLLQGGHLLAAAWLRRFSPRRLLDRRLLVVGDEERGRLVAERLQQQLSFGHTVVDVTALPGDGPAAHCDFLSRALIEEHIDEVVFALPADRNIPLAPLIDHCRRLGVAVRILPSMWSPAGPDLHMAVENCQGMPFLTICPDRFNAAGLLYKRLLDLAGGTVGAVLCLAIFPVVALAIKLDSPGPVLFRQRRVGLHGRLFTLYKFRTMVVDAEARKEELRQVNEMEWPMFKLRDDPRCTRVGRFLRRWSLDEFPQFFNVLRGEMSLVGTRPPTPDEVTHYGLPHHRRLAAKPGITGLWQVSGRNAVRRFEDIVALDCAYIDNWRFLLDLKILLRTVVVLFRHPGAC